MPNATAKLERLIEREARERLEALTAEEFEERVEARATVLAEQMFAVRHAAEREAIEAEHHVDPPDASPPGGEPTLRERIEAEERRQAGQRSRERGVRREREPLPYPATRPTPRDMEPIRGTPMVIG
jgi:hypothetical protein